NPVRGLLHIDDEGPHLADLAEQFAGGRRGPEMESARVSLDSTWDHYGSYAPDHSYLIPLAGIFEEGWDFLRACSLFEMFRALTASSSEEEPAFRCGLIRERVGDPFRAGR